MRCSSPRQHGQLLSATSTICSKRGRWAGSAPRLARRFLPRISRLPDQLLPRPQSPRPPPAARFLEAQKQLVDRPASRPMRPKRWRCSSLIIWRRRSFSARSAAPAQSPEGRWDRWSGVGPLRSRKRFNHELQWLPEAWPARTSTCRDWHPRLSRIMDASPVETFEQGLELRPP